MSDTVDSELLLNCTLVAVSKFPWSTPLNLSQIRELNRTENYDLLADMISHENNYKLEYNEVVTIK